MMNMFMHKLLTNTVQYAHSAHPGMVRKKEEKINATVVVESCPGEGGREKTTFGPRTWLISNYCDPPPPPQQKAKESCKLMCVFISCWKVECGA
jgi:hypothetical protein